MIHLIVGPPGAGKTTYATEHARPGDQIIDRDQIKARGLTDRQARDAQARAEHRAREHPGDTWIVRTLADPADRQDFAARIGVDHTITLDPGDDTCRARVQARDGNTDKFEGIARWRALNPQTRNGDTMSQDTSTADTAQDAQDGAQEPAAATDRAGDAPEAQEGAQEPQEGDEQPKGNREAAKYRKRLRETEERLEAVQAQLDDTHRAQLERLATDEKIVSKPATLWALGFDLADVRDEGGRVNEDAARERLKAFAAEYGLTPRTYPPNAQGFRPLPSGKGSGWGTAFEPRADV